MVAEMDRRKPAVSPVGSWLLVCSVIVVVGSLLLPWFRGRISTSFTEFSGYQLGLAVFCALVVASAVASGVWSSWVRRAFFLVLLSLAASISTVLFTGLMLALSSMVDTAASTVGAGSVVDADARVGVKILLLGGLLGVAGSVIVLARWAQEGAVAVARGPALRGVWTRQEDGTPEPVADPLDYSSGGTAPQESWGDDW